MALDPHKIQRHDYLLKYTIVPLIPRWIKPNHFTVLRLLLTPVVLFLLIKGNYVWGVPLFGVAAVTDLLDGSLARLRQQVTPWGIFYDPIVDKLLIGTVAILIFAQHINIWLALIIIGLDLVLVLGGFLRRRDGQIPMANTWGKMKMVLQVAGVMALLTALWLGVDLFIPFSIGTFSLAVVFAVISLFTYGL